MIPFVPIAFAVLALLAWRYDARERRAYEATLSEAEKRQFRALRRIHPAKWRALIALKQAETKSAAQQAGKPPQDARVTYVQRGIMETSTLIWRQSCGPISRRAL